MESFLVNYIYLPSCCPFPTTALYCTIFRSPIPQQPDKEIRTLPAKQNNDPNARLKAKLPSNKTQICYICVEMP